MVLGPVLPAQSAGSRQQPSPGPGPDHAKGAAALSLHPKLAPVMAGWDQEANF